MLDQSLQAPGFVLSCLQEILINAEVTLVLSTRKSGGGRLWVLSMWINEHSRIAIYGYGYFVILTERQ